MKYRIAKKLFEGRTVRECIERGICMHCKNRVYYDENHVPTGDPGQIYTEAGLDEFHISGICETCFDKIIKESE